ncbi:hypothetical protein VCR12J2_620125 [Vibrio coralliirubri]|nr:hypothetical protein VCR12J2_620125 [Vibrio coralliirubri]
MGYNQASPFVTMFKRYANLRGSFICVNNASTAGPFLLVFSVPI